MSYLGLLLLRLHTFVNRLHMPLNKELVTAIPNPCLGTSCYIIWSWTMGRHTSYLQYSNVY